MKIAVFSAHEFEKKYLDDASNGKHELVLIREPLNDQSVYLAAGCQAASLFVSDDASAPVLETLSQLGIRFLSLRSAGFDHVDLASAHALNIKVARVPAYSPYAIAEHAVALMLALNRKLIVSQKRVSTGNFSLDGLVGFDMHKKTAGIIGTGRIGSVTAKILHGFGCRLLAYDNINDPSLQTDTGICYTDLDTLLQESDVISLHLPLNKATAHLIDKKNIAKMKEGVFLINTARGGLVDTQAVIDALKTGSIGAFGADVYEKEKDLFFTDHSQEILQDDLLARLMSFSNVIITGHQGFLTDTALANIAKTSIYNIDCFEKKISSGNEVEMKVLLD